MRTVAVLGIVGVPALLFWLHFRQNSAPGETAHNERSIDRGERVIEYIPRDN